MKTTHYLLAAAMTGMLAMATAAHADGDSAKEKCYGIAKAGKNDCASKMASSPRACATSWLAAARLRNSFLRSRPPLHWQWTGGFRAPACPGLGIL
jgi:hypothetical protein